jgi:hypothetical protein
MSVFVLIPSPQSVTASSRTSSPQLARGLDFANVRIGGLAWSSPVQSSGYARLGTSRLIQTQLNSTQLNSEFNPD